MLNGSVVPVLVALIMLSSPALAGTWYVNGVNGDDGNNCKTKATACATIGHAISLAASGDTIQIAAATYQENLSIPFNLTLNGAKAATTIVDGTNYQQCLHGRLRHQSYAIESHHQKTVSAIRAAEVSTIPVRLPSTKAIST